MTTTIIALRLDAKAPVPIKTQSIAQPPSILIEFPPDRVVGSLPERSTVGRGVVRAILTYYHPRDEAQSARYLRSLQLVLSAPYTSRVRSTASSIVIEIDHPASFGGTQMEVGLKGGTIIGGLGSRQISERFHAMQRALAGAAPMTWTMQLSASAPPVAAPSAGDSVTAPARPAASAASPARARSPADQAVIWVLFAAGLALAGAGVWRIARERTAGARWRMNAAEQAARMSFGMALVDQLVWRAFEQRGYQLVMEQELQEAPGGTWRIMTKDNARAALLCTGNGPFFEKQTVHQCIRLMKRAEVAQGFMVAAGSFTVPAQRLAKAHQVTLIGRDELAELLSIGAASEYVTRQLEVHRLALEEAKAMLRQYSSELETLRRQRNEASWYLGEERAKSVKVEAEMASAAERTRAYEAELEQWKREAEKLRAQWEESQWYLGEAQARVRYLDEQLSFTQATTQRAEQERDDAQGSLGEARGKREALEAALAELQQTLEASTQRTQELEGTLDRLSAELRTLRIHWGERRTTVRVHIPQVIVELRNESPAPLFCGAPRDVSPEGIGLDTAEEMPGSSIQMRVSLPNLPEPIETSGRLMWQRANGKPTGYHSGYKLTELSQTARARLEQLIEQFQPPPIG